MTTLTKTLTALCLALVLCAGFGTLYAQTAAQGKKEATIHDSFVRETAGSVRLKAGFVGKKKGDSSVEVTNAKTGVIVGTLKCGSCSGGACSSSVSSSSLSCSGCGQAPNNSCTLNPF